MIGLAVLILIVGLLAFIRLAPTDVARWHVPVTAREDKDLTGGAIRVIEGSEARMQALQEIALNTDRTSLIAGSAQEGMMTFQTRSFWMGYPDQTTVHLDGDQIRMFARLRFGQSDMGVNKARLEAWIGALDGQ
jgi:uncharacterized protein (DUF1499 family)